MYTIASFYHFFDFPDFEQQREPMLKFMQSQNVRGSILVAPEGMNGTVGGERGGIEALLAYLAREIVKAPFEHKESYSERPPFRRAKVRLKKETIGLGESFSMEKRGTYVDPKDWNALITDPDTIVLDTRNDYEVHLGKFKRAIDPNIPTFKYLPDYVRKELAGDKKKKIATYCTGGIRCEKFTAWMLEQGYENVYHLKGGILKYLEEIPPEQSTWEGECFVFDQRVAVGHGLVPSPTAKLCRKCDQTLTAEDQQHPKYIENVSCGYCAT